MEDIKFLLKDGSQFVCRTVGVIVNNNKVLLQGRKGKSTWGFLGGSIASFESSKEAIIRECKEEIGENVKVKRLLAVVEDFFNYLGKYNVHQISFYYLIELDTNSKLLKIDEFDGIEEGKNLTFKWFDINDSDTLIKPRQIFEKLKNNDNTIKHIILKEL